MKRALQFIIILALCASAASQVAAQEEDCACINCPVQIYNNQVSYAYFNAQVNGENDLGSCPLTQVCFEISHTWIGDLSASLISPDGTHYLVMADINNDTLGCGNQYNNINVCVNIGTDNPLTNNEEYECNGEPWACLNGDDWTVPCGGVTDPRTPAVQAPNCDLNDFNTPGAPANGTWTLAVSDICPWDVGFIETFTLEFECGAGCFSCNADGGTLPLTEVTACAGSEELNLQTEPIWETEQPDTLDYGYTFLLVQDDIILAYMNTPDLTDAPAGEYLICGFSYILIEASQLPQLIGQSYSALQNNPGFCADFSADSAVIIIEEAGSVASVHFEKCADDCITFEETDYCEAGIYEVIYPTAEGCDSTVYVNITDYETSATVEVNLSACADACIVYEEVEYCTPGTFPLVYADINGCDSLVNLTIHHYPPTETTEIELLVCENNCAVFQGTEYCTAGDYEVVLTNENGCDSLINLTVSNYNAVEPGSALLEICADACGTYDGTEYCASGLYPLTYTTADGCDSLVNLTVSYYDTEPVTETELLICAGACAEYAGVQYCEAGTFPVTFQNQNGCDSVVNILVSVAEVSAEIADFPALSCSVDEVILNAAASVGETLAWTDENGATIGNTAQLTVQTAGCYTLTVTQSGCSTIEQICVTDESQNPPTVQISGAATACLGDEVIYTAASEGTVDIYHWSVPAGADIIGATDGAQITVVWNSTAGGSICVAAENACGTSEADCLPVTIGSVAVADVTEDCDLTTEAYTVTFQINSAAEDFEVTGTTTGTLVGNIFTSLPIAGGTPYSFTVNDNICEQVTVNGINECVCNSSAGVLSGSGSTVCAEETAVLEYPENVILDSDDALLFVLHNGTATEIGPEIYAVKTQPEFELTPDMVTNYTYFAAAVTGDATTNTIDWEDACLSVSVGLPIIFTAEASATLSGDTEICDGGEAVLHLSFTGLPPFSAVINGETFNDLPAEYDHTVNVTATTDFVLESVNDAGGCTTETNQTVTVTVHHTPTLNVQPIAFICNTDGADDIHFLNFNDFFTDIVIPGTWEDTDGSNAVGSFPLLDFYGVAPGDYTFTFTTDVAAAPCAEVTAQVVVTVENCSCPDGAFDSVFVCNEGGDVILSDLQNEQNAGIWTILSAPTGQNPATIADGIFQADAADAGIYTLQFMLSNVPDGCPDTWENTVTVSAALSAGTTNAALEFCAETEDVVDLNTQLTGADAGGIWSDTSEAPAAANAFNSATGMLEVQNLAAGNYTFTYTQTPTAPCAPSAATVTVTVHTLPTADAGSDQTVTCEESALTLGGANTSSDLTYTWYLNDGLFSQEINPTATESGTYTLVVSNDFGCTASDVVVIDNTASQPTADVTVIPVGCYDESDGALLVENVSGGIEPYLFSLNGEPFSEVPDLTGLAAATYNLVIEDANGCQSEINFDITQPQETLAVLTATLDNEDPPTITLGESFDMELLLNIPEEEINSITWTGGEYLDCDTCLSVTATPIETTTFTVTIQANECAEISTAITVFVKKEHEVFIPNVFSPDDDGNNDVFYIFGDDNVRQVNSFAIFTRWGEQIFAAHNFMPNDPVHGWDGTHKGQDLNNGVYVYFAEVEFIDGEKIIFEGDVTIVR